MTDLLIEEQIAAALETVLPGQAWPVILPQNPIYPAITYHRRDYENKADQWSLNPLLLRGADGPRSTFQIVIYAHPYTEGAHLLRQVKTALETVPGLKLDSVQDGYEFEQMVYAIITEWTVWGDLETTVQGLPGDWPAVQPVVDAILADLTQGFGKRVETVRFHDPSRRTLVTPALVLDLESFDLGAFPGDGRTPLRARWVLHCLMPQTPHGSEVLVRSMAAELFARVTFNKWRLGTAVDFPENVEASQATLWPGLYGHNHWTVSWDQVLYWAADEPPRPPPICPEDAYGSFKPAIGADHEADYVKLEPSCEDDGPE